LIVVVADDGSGVDDPASISESGNLGLQIVRTLTQNELQGVLEFRDNEPGMRVEIRLPFP
jgi:two-component sensor histidine kinase